MIESRPTGLYGAALCAYCAETLGDVAITKTRMIETASGTPREISEQFHPECAERSRKNWVYFG